MKAPEKRKSSDNIHILEEIGVPFFSELGYKLVKGNAPIHRPHPENEWKTRNGLQSFLWPEHSPKLNPTENVWAFVKTQLRSMKLEFADLEGAVCYIWNKIPSKLVSKLYESMPKRIEKCISNTGFPTIIDIMVVLVFSVRFIAYEIILHERELLIRQCMNLFT